MARSFRGQKGKRTDKGRDGHKERMGMGATRAARLLVVPEAITHPKKERKCQLSGKKRAKEDSNRSEGEGERV